VTVLCGRKIIDLIDHTNGDVNLIRQVVVGCGQCRPAARTKPAVNAGADSFSVLWGRRNVDVTFCKCAERRDRTAG